jgi:PAS domain S-box-containing protein
MDEARCGILEAVDTRLLEIIDSLPDATFVIDPRGCVVAWNPAIEEMTGVSRDAMVGRGNYAYALPFYGERRPLLADLVGESNSEWLGCYDLVRRRGETIVAETFAPALRDGQGAHLWGAASPIRDQDGGLIGYVETIRDLTEHERIREERLRQASRMEAVGRLAGGIAHDFNNLLGAIRGYSELVASSLADGDPRRADLQQVLRAADRASEMTRKLLAFGRQQLLEPRVINPADAVEEIAPLLRRLLGEDIALSVTSELDIWHVMADPSQMEQVIVNLAVNARDAMPAGGRLAITLANTVLGEDFSRVHPEVPIGPYVELKVADTGAGMDAETLIHAFEPFYTTKAPGAGSGLGLASVYGIVKQSAGFVYAVSEPGRGTEFEIYLPRRSPSAERLESPDPEPLLPRGSATVLVVEDDVAVRDVMRRVLDPLGYRVLVAGTADEALALAYTETQIDLLITDVGMPDIRGPELAAQFLASRTTLRVLLVSGYTEDTLATRGDIEPGVGFLSKPFTAHELAQSVHEALRD